MSRTELVYFLKARGRKCSKFVVIDEMGTEMEMEVRESYGPK